MSINFIAPKLDLQAAPIGPKTKDSTAVYRSTLSADLVECNPKTNCRTLHELLEYSIKHNGQSNCLGRRKLQYEWMTYAEVGKARTEIGSGIMHLVQKYNIQPMLGELTTQTVNIGIYSVNRPEWLLVDFACNAYSLASVALYDTLGEESIKFILQQSKLDIVFVSLDRLPSLLRFNVKVIICMDEVNETCRMWANQRQITLITFKELQNLGRNNPKNHIPPKSKDIATVCYTSGTTGEPKGALLSHLNFCAQNVFCYLGIDLTNKDVYLSYLPLAHIFERTGVLQMLSVGAGIGFYSGAVEKILEDAQMLKPTFFISVPRLLNKIYAKIKESTLDAKGLRGVLFRRGYKTRLETFQPDKYEFLFKKVRALLGGQVRFMVSGSAPLGKEVLEFLRVFFGCHVLQGYGQTENTAAATVQLPFDRTTNVGPPLVSVEMKLKSVVEMNYLSSNNTGEVCLRGPIVFHGYLLNKKATVDALQDGWLHTGDIGSLDQCGRLTIIDRKKNIFKLAQGEYIAPEKLENIYSLCKSVAQIYVHGDSLQSSLVAIVVPNSTENLLLELQHIAKEHKLQGFEYIKAIHVEKVPFSVENGLLTPSFKLKRPELQKRYQKEIQNLYKSLLKPKI